MGTSLDEIVSEFNKNAGLLSTHNYLSSPEEISLFVSGDVTGQFSDMRRSMEEVFITNVAGYINETFNGVLLNNVANTNAYLRTNIASEFERIQSLHSRLKNQIYKNRIDVLEKTYNVHYNRFRIKIVQATTIVTLLCVLISGFILGNTISLGLGMLMIIGILVIYIVGLALALRVNGRRRIDDWDKYYFAKPKNK